MRLKTLLLNIRLALFKLFSTIKNLAIVRFANQKWVKVWSDLGDKFLGKLWNKSLKKRLSFSLHQSLTGLLVLLTICLCTACQTIEPNSSPRVDLTLWQGINPPPNREVFDRLVDHFNKTHPQIHVHSVYAGQSEQQLPKILTSVVGDVAPDLLWFSPTVTGQLVELDAIVPLTDWFANLPIASEIDPALREAMTFADDRGQDLWSVPMATNNVAVFYRPSLFQQAGIASLPQTWTDFQQVARQLTQDRNGDGRIDQRGMLLPLGKSEWTVFTWLPFLFSAGGSPIVDQVPNLATPEAQQALTFWVDLLKAGTAQLSQPERGFELDDFLAGRVAMQITGPWTLEQLNRTGVDYGVLPIPQAKMAATVVGGEHLFVMKTDSVHQQAALTFLEYVLSEAFQTEWAIGTGYLPVNLQARLSPAYQQYITDRPVLKVFLEQMAVARSRPSLPGYARFSDILGRAIEQTLLGEKPENSLNLAQKRIEQFW